MKKIVFALVVLFTAAAAMAQDAPAKETRKSKRQLTPEEQALRKAVEAKLFKQNHDRIAIDLLGTNWIYNPNGPRFNGLKSKPWGRGINVYFYWDFKIKKSRFSIAPGIGYAATNVYHRHELVEDSLGIHFTPLANPSDYKVNKICLQYIDIPVEFRIRTNPDKLDNMWKFAIGFKAGIRVDAHTKQKVSTVDGTKVYVERRFPDFNMFRMGPTLRIGYSSFNITGYVGVLNLWKKDRGPMANEFAVGISFNGL